MGKNVLTYNGVSFPFMKTNRFSSECVMDPSGSDYLYTKITITVQTVLHSCNNGQTPQEWINSNRKFLMAPRGELKFVCDGTEFLVSPQDGEQTLPVGHADANLGPKPISLDITQFINTSAIVEYTIETYILDCDISEDAPFPKILSHRWTCSHTVDAEYYSTRVLTGQMVFNGMWIERTVDGLKLTETTGKIVPPIPRGWKRESIHTEISADGLKLNYTITDKETHMAVPKPAVLIDATYSETCAENIKVAQNHMTMCEVNVSVQGEPRSHATAHGRQATDYNALMEIASQIVLSRINPNKKEAEIDNVGEFITRFKVTEDIFKNKYTISVTTLKSRALNQMQGFLTGEWDGSFALTRVGSPVNIYDLMNNYPRHPDQKGNYTLYLFTQILMSACTEDDSKGLSDRDYSDNTNIDYDLAPYPDCTYTTTIVAPDNYKTNTENNLSEDQTTFPFTHYVIDVAYVENYHTIQMPVQYYQAEHCEFAITAQKTRKKRITWEASRVGDYPKAPIPTNYVSEDDKLLFTDFRIGNVELETDGITKRYYASGVYEYAMYKHIDYDNDTYLEHCASPHINHEWGDDTTKFPVDHLVKGIIGPTT